MELLVPLEWCENVVTFNVAKKFSFILIYEGRYSTLKNRLREKSDFGKS